MSKIVEKNPTKFRIDGAELAIRKGFIESTKEEVRRMKERLTNQSRGNLERVANQVRGEVISNICVILKIIPFSQVPPHSTPAPAQTSTPACPAQPTPPTGSTLCSWSSSRRCCRDRMTPWTWWRTAWATSGTCQSTSQMSSMNRLCKSHSRMCLYVTVLHD